MSRGFVFTMDVLIGLSLLIITMMTFAFFEFESVLPEKEYERLNYLTDDILNLLSYLEVRDAQDKPTINKLIEDGTLTDMDLDKSVLDLIASFWYNETETSKEIARNISREILEGITDYVCINITVENETIYNSPCDTLAEDVAVAARIETGYVPGKPAYGYIARAFLTSIKSKEDSSFVYYGGYIGEGNISRVLYLPPFDSILGVYMELYIGDDFDLYINGYYSGHYNRELSKPTNMTTDKWYLSPSNYTFFNEGDNKILINFTNKRSYISGGYFRVKYNTTQMASEETLGIDNISLPGIYGVINLYDAFYVPGNLSTMEVFLDFTTNNPLFMNIGNKTVYQGNSSTLISNSTLSALLDYNYLSHRTVPFRMGHYTLNNTTGTGQVTDVFLTTSLVDAMNLCDLNSTPPSNITPDCCPPVSSICPVSLPGVQNARLDLAKKLDKIFVNVILNNTGNRVGLVSYKAQVNDEDIVPLTNDNTTLIAEINSYEAKPGQRCLCCAIHEAKLLLSDPSRKKYILLMSDGSAEKAPLGLCPIGPKDDFSQAAINEACDAYANHSIQVYTVGFGQDADNAVLQAIAACGGGEWMASTNYTGLEEIYKKFAEKMGGPSIVYQFQTIVSTNINSSLHPDSYIFLNYTPDIVPYEYGEISLNREGNRLSYFTGNSVDKPCKEGWYDISNEVKVVDAKMTSYSAEFWTDRLEVNSSATGDWSKVFWLGDFGNNYLVLGDPYIVQIPVDLIAAGNNSVCIGSGFNVTNATGGSPDSRLIYTMRVRGVVGYGQAFNSSEEAQNDAKSRLIDKIKEYVNVTSDDVLIDYKMVSQIQWLWGPSLLKIVAWNKE
jgi:hypothetical protein